MILSVWSCSYDQTKKQKSVSNYYDINGLIDEQVKLLDSINPSFFKKATIDRNEEIQDFAPTDSSWAKELMTFKSTDINKPTLTESYFTQESEVADNKKITYISKRPRSTEVDSLSIIFIKNTSNPLRINACLVDHNELYTSEKFIELSFRQLNGVNLISSYRINGWQKMIMQDSTSYYVEARINY